MTQLTVNIITLAVLAVTVIAMIAIRFRFSVKFDKTIKLRQHKLDDVNEPLHQSPADICLVNDMSECGYGVGFEDYGVMTAEFDKDAPSYNACELSLYCKSKGITADKLTDEELDSLRCV